MIRLTPFSSLFLLFASARGVDPDGFVQVGSDINGYVASDGISDVGFGETISLNANDGSRLVIGAPEYDFDSPTPVNLNEDGGAIFLYDHNGTEWEFFTSFHGVPGENMGDRFSISADGSRIAIRRYITGAPDEVEVYDLTTIPPTQIGSALNCGAEGSTVSLSPDGNRVAVSCEYFGTNNGLVEIFEYDSGGDVWSSMGTLNSTDEFSLFGWSTAFDDSGNRLAVSAPNYDFAGVSRSGLVRIFQHDGAVWNQLGADLAGTTPDEQHGFSMDISGDGNTLAIGSPSSDGSGTHRGTVKLYSFQFGSWVQVGDPIDGEANNDRFGRSTALSVDGTRVAASSYLHNGQRGQLRLFELQADEWVQVGGDIEGESPLDRFGFGVKSVSLSGDGFRVVSGSTRRVDEFGSSTGRVRVFDELRLSNSPSSFPSAMPSVAPSRTSSPSVQTTNVASSSTLPSSAPTDLPTVSSSPSSSPSSAPTTAQTNSAVPSESVSTEPSSWNTAVGTILPTATLGKFEWDLERVGDPVVAFNEQSAEQEILLGYNISLRNYTISLFEDDCLTPVPDTVLATSSSMTVASSKHGSLIVSIDVKQDAVVNSTVWSEDVYGLGLISTCVRVDLVLGEGAGAPSVNFHEQKLYIFAGLTQGFTVLAVELDRIGPDVAEEDANFDYGIYACQCNSFFECSNDILTQGSDLFICIMTNATDIEIVGVESLDLVQDAFTVSPIVNGTEDALTAVTIAPNRTVIQNQLLSAFFSVADPSDILAQGVVSLAFSNGESTTTRHLGSSRIGNERGLGRSLQQGGSAHPGEQDDTGFHVVMKLAGSDTDDEGSSSGANAISALAAALFAMTSGLFALFA